MNAATYMNKDYIINFEKYDVEVNEVNEVSKYKNYKKFNMFSDEIEVIKNKIINNREKDGRYSFKNRRIVNKDWKDFNNNQM
jgi:hypothetical protein